MQSSKRYERRTGTRQARHRKNKKSAPLRNGGSTGSVTTQMRGDRNRLIEWARKAPLDHVGKVLTYIENLSLPDEAPNPDLDREPAIAM